MTMCSVCVYNDANNKCTIIKPKKDVEETLKAIRYSNCPVFKLDKNKK